MGFCHTSTWISHRHTYVSCLDPPSHFPPWILYFYQPKRISHWEVTVWTDVYSVIFWLKSCLLLYLTRALVVLVLSESDISIWRSAFTVLSTQMCIVLWESKKVLWMLTVWGRWNFYMGNNEGIAEIFLLFVVWLKELRIIFLGRDRYTLIKWSESLW